MRIITILIVIMVLAMIVPVAGSIVANLAAGGDAQNCIQLLEDKWGYWVLAGGGHFVPGDLLPSVDNTWDIGSDAQSWADGWFNGILYAKTGGGYTYVIATSDATVSERAHADLVLTGTPGTYENPIALNALLAGCTGGESFRIVGKNAYFSAPVVMPDQVITFDFRGITVRWNHDGRCFDWTSTNRLHLCKFLGGTIYPNAAAIAGANARALVIENLEHSLIDFRTDGIYGGSALEMISSVTTWCELNEIYLYAHSCKNAVLCTGTTSLSYNKFRYLGWSPVDANNNIMVDATNNTGAGLYSCTFDNIAIWTGGTAPRIGFYGFAGDGYRACDIRYIAVDTLGADFHTGYIFDDEALSSNRVGTICYLGTHTLLGTREANDKSKPYIDNIIKESGANESINRAFPAFLAELYSRAMVIQYAYEGITSYDSANGTHYAEMGGNFRLRSGPDVGGIGGIGGGATGEKRGYTTWDEAQYFVFNIAIQTDDANRVSYVQWKNTAAEGALVTHGLGIRVTSATIYADSYGSGGVEYTQTLGETLDTATSTFRQIIIVFIPGERVQWWVDGVLKVEQTDPTMIPSLTSNYFVATTRSGNPATDHSFFVTYPMLFILR